MLVDSHFFVQLFLVLYVFLNVSNWTRLVFLRTSLRFINPTSYWVHRNGRLLVLWLSNFWFMLLIRIFGVVVLDVSDESVNILLDVFSILTFIAHLIVVQFDVFVTLILRFIDPIVLFLLNLFRFDGSRTVAAFLTFQVLSIRLVPSGVDFTIQFMDVSRLSCWPIYICSIWIS